MRRKPKSASLVVFSVMGQPCAADDSPAGEGALHNGATLVNAICRTFSDHSLQPSRADLSHLLGGEGTRILPRFSRLHGGLGASVRARHADLHAGVAGGRGPAS